MSDITTAPGTELSLDIVARDMPKTLKEGQEKNVQMRQAMENLPAIVDEHTKQVSMSYVARIKQRLEEFNAERMPFTRKLNEIIKQFTAVESERKELIDTVEAKLNKYVKEELNRARAAQAKIDAEVELQKAKIALEGRIREYLQQRIDALLDSVRNGIAKLVDTVTPENIKEIKEKLNGDPKWFPEKQEPFYSEVPPWVTDEFHFKGIVTQEINGHIAIYLEKAKKIMTDALAIVDIALTNKAEAQKLQEAAKETAAKESEAEAARIKAKADAEQSFAGMDAEKVEAPKARIKMRIEVESKAGWAQIVGFWFEHNKEDLEDYPKRTLLQMKTFAEKKCLSDGILITHEDVHYIEDVKAK